MKEFIIEPEKEYTIYTSRVGGEHFEETFLGKDLSDNHRELILADEIKKYDEIKRCQESPYYFMTNYVWIKGKDGEKKRLERVMGLTEEEFNGVVNGELELWVKKKRRK